MSSMYGSTLTNHSWQQNNARRAMLKSPMVDAKLLLVLICVRSFCETRGGVLRHAHLKLNKADYEAKLAHGIPGTTNITRATNTITVVYRRHESDFRNQTHLSRHGKKRNRRQSAGFEEENRRYKIVAISDEGVFRIVPITRDPLLGDFTNDGYTSCSSPNGKSSDELTIIAACDRDDDDVHIRLLCQRAYDKMGVELDSVGLTNARRCSHNKKPPLFTVQSVDNQGTFRVVPNPFYNDKYPGADADNQRSPKTQFSYIIDLLNRQRLNESKRPDGYFHSSMKLRKESTLSGEDFNKKYKVVPQDAPGTFQIVPIRNTHYGHLTVSDHRSAFVDGSQRLICRLPSDPDEEGTIRMDTVCRDGTLTARLLCEITVNNRLRTITTDEDAVKTEDGSPVSCGSDAAATFANIAIRTKALAHQRLLGANNARDNRHGTFHLKPIEWSPNPGVYFPNVVDAKFRLTDRLLNSIYQRQRPSTVPSGSPWTSWLTWSSCDAPYCGYTGSQTRTRTCKTSNCLDRDREYKTCISSPPCTPISTTRPTRMPTTTRTIRRTTTTTTATPTTTVDARYHWGSWQKWGSCQYTYGRCRGARRRLRDCHDLRGNQVQSSKCAGLSVQSEDCVAKWDVCGYHGRRPRRP